MRLRTPGTLPLAVVLAAAVVAAPAGAEPAPTRVADACEATSDPMKDVKSVAFGYNDEAFQVGVEMCGGYHQSGDWLITVHLTSFEPEVQLSALLQEVGRYEYWSGFRFCAASSCPIVDDPDRGVQQPTGSRLEDVGWGSGEPVDDCYPQPDGCTPQQLAQIAAEPRNPFAHGAWSRHLPAGTPIPRSIEWWVETRDVANRSTPATQLDRAPDGGTVTSQLLPPGRVTVVNVNPGAPPTWRPSWGGLRTDTGTLRSDSATGPGVRTRLVSIPGSSFFSTASATAGRTPTDAGGGWSNRYYLKGNTTARVSFQGDGVNAAATSAPFHAYVRAWVTLDIAGRQRVGRAVELRGVVRPRGAGSVEVLVKPDKPGYAWWVLRQTNLVSGTFDSYYRVPWTPRTRGRYVLVTRWRHGTTDDGGVLNGQSEYRYVTVI